MGVNSPSMKTHHRATQGLGWCIETRVWIPAFLLWTRRSIYDLPWRGASFDIRFVIPSQASSSAKGGLPSSVVVEEILG